jgi:chromosome segregation ATPase
MQAAEAATQLPTWVAVVLAVVGSGGISAAITGLLLWRANRSKLIAEAKSENADATEVYSKAAITLLEPLERRLKAADEQIDKQAKAMAELTAELNQARRELTQARLDLADARNEIGKLQTEITTLRGG